MAILSILTPTLNQAPFLEQAIASVAGQEPKHFEHVVVDGGSTDGTLDILRRYPHVKWTSEPDDGQADAINKGIRRSKGEVIGVLNGDDYYAPDVLGAVSDFFGVHPECRILYGDITYVDENGRRLGNICGDNIRLETLKSNPDVVRHPSTFVHRSLFDEIGFFDARLHLVFDFEFLYRAALRHPFHYLPRVLSNFRQHAGAKTQRFMRRQAVEILGVSLRYRFFSPRLGVFLLKRYLRGIAPLYAAVRAVRGQNSPEQ